MQAYAVAIPVHEPMDNCELKIVLSFNISTNSFVLPGVKMHGKKEGIKLISKLVLGCMSQFRLGLIDFFQKIRSECLKSGYYSQFIKSNLFKISILCDSLILIMDNRVLMK